MNAFSFELQLKRSVFTLALDADVKQGECLGVFGHSGSGKTSLLRTLAGLENSASGHFKSGKQLFSLSGKNRFKKMAMLFQDGLLFPHMSVEKNLNFSKQFSSTSSYMSESQIIDFLELENLLEKKADRLSGGERKRVALAQVLFSKPELLLLDEPFAFLDNKAKSSITRMLQELKESFGVSLILVSHEILDLCQLSENLLVLEKGQPCFKGSIDEALTSKDSPFIRQLGYFVPSPFVGLKANVESFDKRYGLSELKTENGQKIRISTEHKVGDNVLVKLDAQQVSLALVDERFGIEQMADQLSILNQLDGLIEEVLFRDDYKVLLLINCHGDRIISQISGLSFQKMALKNNSKVKVLIKAASIHEI